MNISSDEEVDRDESNVQNKVTSLVSRQMTELQDGTMSERKLAKFEKRLSGTYEP